MTLTDLRILSEKTVLTKSSRDKRNPPVALRGTIEVQEDPREGGSALVEISLDFPQMFSTQAHHHTLTLDPAAIERLIASERNGTYEITIDEPLNPEPPRETA